jgi:two-component system chemotaxis sensor kinase CheA
MKEIKMLPISTILEGFGRMVRDIGLQQKKEVSLEISGAQTELDKKVLELIKTPLMHILRNCIDHGIEEAQKRAAQGKPCLGTIRLSVFHKAGDVIIEIEDDGKGIDVEEVRQTCLKKGLVSSQDLETMTEKEILNLVFMNGYSTSPIITDISGRGIGLDVVRHDIESLKGQIFLDTEKGKGTKFTLLLPLTIAIVDALLLKTKGMLFAMAMASIEEVIKVNVKEISTIEGRMAIELRGHTVPIVRLSEVLGIPSAEKLKGESGQTDEVEAETKTEMSVVITSSLDKRVGFIIDEIIGGEEIFIKSLGEYIGKLNSVSGATILGTGEVVVILDVRDLITQSALAHPAVLGRKQLVKEQRRKKVILVVEDALSTRELLKGILESHGYQVDTAVDGLDAMDKITKFRYDLIVSDINMPRMDGFELCAIIRKNEQYKDIPVIIVTALEKEEDKRRGIEVGAAAYIVKGAFDQSNLLDTIEMLIR